MRVCTECAERNPELARFCMTCGEPLPTLRIAERRKLATFLFCDLVGSTAMGEQIDIESFREVMFRYFDDSRRIVERHGGIVEKFIGDAILAVFGALTAKEDDALRAVTADLEIQAHVCQLNVQLDQRFGRIIELRLGINTGEFIVGRSGGDEPNVVVGDVANVAARLEQIAGPGEVLISERTHRLTRGAIDVVPVGPLELKGKARPMSAYQALP